jgi:hypothetical protein
VNRPSTAREALIVEAIGDVAQLIDRAEALTRAMEQSRQTLVQAGAQLESRMAAITDNAEIKAVQHIARRTNELTLRLRDEQTRAMAEAARSLFAIELGPTLQRLAVPLQHLLERPWDHWLTHAATAAVASAATWVLAVYG